MGDVELKKSPVVFDKESHTYTLGERTLQGITGIITSQLFPDKYAGVSASVLRNAAERGTSVHEEIEMAENGFEPDEPREETLSWKKIKSEARLEWLESEYTVSDEKDWASNIDLVMRDADGGIVLADIKTTYRPDLDYAGWQLGVYRYLFELQNPGLEVKRLLIVWLRDGKGQLIEVTAHGKEEVKRLLDDSRDGVQFVPDSVKEENVDAQAMFGEAPEESVARLWAMASKIEKMKKTVSSNMKGWMQDKGLTSFGGSLIKVSLSQGAPKETFDKERFREEHPDLWAEYVTLEDATPRLLVTLTKDAKKKYVDGVDETKLLSNF